MEPILLALLLVAPSSADAPALERGDAAWERRAEGHRGGDAAPGPIAGAVAAYEEALAARPESLEPHWKLLRALYFQGEYTTDDREAKRRIFGRGREVAEAAFEILAARAGGHQALDAMSPDEVAARLAGPGVVDVYFWAAVDWGLWGEAFSKLAAARQGVARRLREYSRTVIALDPTYENGGGHRILGRLHAEAPRIPLVTGWVSRDTAVDELRRAVAIAPHDPFNRLYLAEALLDYGGRSALPEARALLGGLAELTPRPATVVEDSRIRDLARARLAALSPPMSSQGGASLTLG